jgi:5S rRNA maturation endonuclease (ribonuclease M5)
MSAALNKVKARLEESSGCDLRRSGAGWSGRCPAHEDGKASLSVGVNKSGDVVLCCHAGCATKAVLEALGLDWGDLFEDGDSKYWTPGGPASAVYAYADEQGALLYEVCRTADKQFRVRRPDPTATRGYAWNLDGTRRVLYLLPNVRDAIKSGQTIYIAEGEKDADALVKAGAVATCNPFGAGKWRDEYTDSLRGADAVVVVADRDDAGRRHARQVERSLRLAGTTKVSLVEAVHGKDASDHLKAGGSLADFVALESEVTSTPTPDQPRLSVIAAREFCDRAEATATEQLVGALIVRGQRTILGGHSGEGKTTFALQMLAASVDGREFLGFQGIGDCRALIIDAEQSGRTLKRRLRETGLDREDVDILHRPEGLSLDSDDGQAADIEQVLAEGNYDVVLIDPLYKLHTGDANDERAMTDLMRRFDGWRETYRFALILPAHLRKPVQHGKPTMHDIAGHGAIVRGAEVVLGIQLKSEGHSRLLFWKDRDGDLPRGKAWNLLFDREHGFSRDPDDEQPKETAVDKVRAALEQRPGLTYQELQERTSLADKTVRDAIKKLGCKREGKPVRCYLQEAAE